MDEQQDKCGWCHAGANGDYSMFKFIHPTDPGRTATLGVYEGKIAIEMTMPGDAEPNRLACDIKYCPMCSRAFDENGD